MSEQSSTFCCMQCRLLQPQTSTCADCGDAMVAPVELVRELLYYRDLNFLDRRDWGLVTAFIAGTSIALPMLAPVAVGSILALAVHKLRAARRRRTIAGVILPQLAATTGTTTLRGVARRFRGSLSSLLDASPVLLEHAVVRDRRGAVLLRRTEATPFLLDVEGSGPVLVTGVTRMLATSVLARRIVVTDSDPRLGRMGVPRDFGITGELEIASIVADGPALAVTGVIAEEVVADLAFHRDGGRIPVMRGRAGAPILVEDRRLVGAALC